MLSSNCIQQISWHNIGAPVSLETGEQVVPVLQYANACSPTYSRTHTHAGAVLPFFQCVHKFQRGSSTRRRTDVVSFYFSSLSNVTLNFEILVWGMFLGSFVNVLICDKSGLTPLTRVRWQLKIDIRYRIANIRYLTFDIRDVSALRVYFLTRIFGRCSFVLRDSSALILTVVPHLKLSILRINYWWLYLKFFISLCNKKLNYPCKSPWRPMGLWDVEAPTFSI
jgi:hypothetical protein